MIASLAAYAATMVSWNRNNKLIESCIVLDKVELIFIALYIRKEIKKKTKSCDGIGARIERRTNVTVLLSFLFYPHINTDEKQ